jgi:hypothetical protein
VIVPVTDGTEPHRTAGTKSKGRSRNEKDLKAPNNNRSRKTDEVAKSDPVSSI